MVKVVNFILRVFYNNNNTHWIAALEFFSFLHPKVCLLIIPMSLGYDALLEQL